MNNKSDKRLIQSVQRASAILDLFVSDKVLGLAEIAQKMSLPKTTIQGIVATLLDLHYLEKDPVTMKYRLGAKLFQLGMKYATNMDLVTISRVWMERLCYQFQQPVNVGMLVGDKIVVVLRIETETRFMVFPQVGSVIPPHTTCIGKIIFAFLDGNERNRLLEGYDFEALTENSLSSRSAFLSELKTVRQEGISFDNEESLIGLAGVGGPIFNHTGELLAGFAITGDSRSIMEKKEKIINEVRYTSNLVSSLLGYEFTEGSQ